MSTRSTPDIRHTDAAIDALGLLSRVYQWVLEEHAVEAAQRRPLSASKVFVLKKIEADGPQTIGELARALGVSDPAVSQLVDALAAERLVVRRTDAEDRRRARLSLTPTGRKQIRAVLSSQRKVTRSALKSAGINPTEQWLAAISDLTEALAKSNDSIYERYCRHAGNNEDA